MSAWLGIDASTQSVTALLVDDSGRTLREETVNFGRDLPAYGAPQGFVEGGAPGEVHADPLMWLDALDLCLGRMRAAGCDFSAVSGISGAGQQHGTVYLGRGWTDALARLDPARGLSSGIAPALTRKTAPIWMDVSTGAECAEIADAVGGPSEVCRRSGSVAIERFSGPQIRRFHKTDPESYRRTARIHLVSSFFASILAGTDAPVDHGDGTGMNLLDLETLEWDPALLEATAPDLRDKLPAPAPSATVIGPVSPYFQFKYGFQPTAKVVAFTGDNPSSLIGMGAASPGTAVVSLGTSDTFFAALPRPTFDPNGYGHVFGNPLGGFMALACFRNGSLAREALRDELGVDWAAFGEEGLSRTPPGNDGNGMVPFFGPEITPRVNLGKPLRFGSEAFRTNPSAGQLIRACLEGQFINVRRETRWIGIEPEVILLTGGASRNDGIAQTLADVMGAPVDRLAASGSVAIGAVIRAAKALGGSADAIERKLSSVVPGSRRVPREGLAEVYSDLEKRFGAALDSFLRDR
ncbi:MAG: xylulokinase [Puniceicoccaceae bacterium]